MAVTDTITTSVTSGRGAEVEAGEDEDSGAAGTEETSEVEAEDAEDTVDFAEVVVDFAAVEVGVAAGRGGAAPRGYEGFAASEDADGEGALLECLKKLLTNNSISTWPNHAVH